MRTTSNVAEFKSENYATWIESLSGRYRQRQIKAAFAVNAEMLKFYFGLGRDLTLMEKGQPWGSGFLKRVSLDLKTKMSTGDCFSPTNLKYMRWFWQLYAPVVFCPQTVDKSEVAISPLPSIADIESAVGGAK